MSARRPAPLALAAALSLAALAAVPGAPPAAAEERGPLLKSGDRVVFFGDSITEARRYTRYVAQYVAVRHPDWDVRFFNAGWGGDTAKGALERVDRDVLALSPTLVTLFFGMNDGGYKPPDPVTTGIYRESLAALVKKLRDRGVRVVVFTPGCVDPDKSQNPKADLRAYQETLSVLTKAALDVAKDAGVPGVDVYHPMLAFQVESKGADPDFSMMPWDGIHPDDTGHLVVARAMLAGLGLEPMAPLGELASKDGPGQGLAVKSWDDASVVLETTQPMPVPFWFDDAAARVMERSGFLETLAGQRLVVGGLPAGDWEVTVDDGASLRVTAATLSRGFFVPGQGSDAGQAVHDLVSMREEAYYSLWRGVRLKNLERPGAARLAEGIVAVDQGYTTAILAAALPRPPGVKIVLTRPPAGDNVARGKPCSTPDPNAWGWTLPALTDGSWQSSRAHCFRTNGSAQFPKSVVIDLEKPHKLTTVRLGVPEFGSTKTISVSVSTDGKKYRNVAQFEFGQGKAERKTLAFTPTTARYVKLTYPDHHPTRVDYDESIVFTTEAEVYTVAK